MKRLTWILWTCAGGLLLALIVISMNRVQAGSNAGSSADARATGNDDAGQQYVARDADDENEAVEREEHEHKATRRHKEKHEEAEKGKEHENKEGKEEEEEEKEEHEQLFRFAKADVGKTPKGWTVDKTGRGNGSAWKVVADSTAPSGTGYVLAQTAKSPGGVFNLCTIDDSKYRDVEIKVCFKAVHGKVDQGGGIVWRYQDANNYYIARMNPLEDNYRFYKVVNGRRTQLASKEHILVPAGQWHTLKIECAGNKIECELDGKKLLEKEDDTFKKAGKVGLWTKADARSYFDNFKVEVEED